MSDPSETTNTSGPPSQTSGSFQPLATNTGQTPSTTQTQAPTSHPSSLVPIIGGALGGLFGLGVIISVIWLYFGRKRRDTYQPKPELSDLEFNVDPFPSGREGKTHRSRPVSEKLAPTPEPVQRLTIVAASTAIDTDTRVPGVPPLAVLPVSDEPRVGPLTGFTTDELVVELNQRIQTQDGRWNDSETLPEYPGSERGGT
ncbi:hypothetical protein V5O48_006055 [Marasmius crinis-equi]|uniref:Uncharacterized protein n=1 Tax=Marasmius crinis-equi TaxID=585013 RepID=A0ABR3FL79_9AGAR